MAAIQPGPLWRSRGPSPIRTASVPIPAPTNQGFRQFLRKGANTNTSPPQLPGSRPCNDRRVIPHPRPRPVRSHDSSVIPSRMVNGSQGIDGNPLFPVNRANRCTGQLGRTAIREKGGPRTILRLTRTEASLATGFHREDAAPSERRPLDPKRNPRSREARRRSRFLPTQRTRTLSRSKARARGREALFRRPRQP